MKAQITLTVAEAKNIIAEGIIAIPQIKRALKNNKIFIKGGTTTSLIAEKLTGMPLKISGRVTPTGTRGTKRRCLGNHSILLNRGKLVDDTLLTEDLAGTIEPGDIVIVGANALDLYGNAAVMVGKDLGGSFGKIFSRFMAEAGEMYITVGLEKLIPGKIQDIIKVAKRKGTKLAMGMCVGLLPIMGNIFTEVEAIESLASVECFVIGKGGISGAEGGTTLLIDGEDAEVKRIFELINSWKGVETSGTIDSLVECETYGPGCLYHYGCIYTNRIGK